MSRKASRPQRSPRRRAGRAVAPKKKGILVFPLVVEGQEMVVRYEPNWSDGEFACGHFEFRSPHEPPRRIAISETGYRSHFAAMAEIESYASPEEFARAFVMACLSSLRKGKRGLPGDGQLSLF
jgi:hypothetical protein